jgi:DNA-binding GntR family transcriptional regulator
VKHLNIVEEAEAKMMAFQFAIATGAQADRLWEILNKKFVLAVASNTNSANTIFLWAQVLLAQVCFWFICSLFEYRLIQL